MNNKLFFQLHPFFLVFPAQQKPYLLLVQHSSSQAFPLSDMPELSSRFECSHNIQNHSHLSDPTPLTICGMVYLSGKSTLLSIMSRLLKRDSGEVLLDGKDILDWDNKELAKKIAILRQSNNINIRLTIRELVSFGRFPHSQGNLKEEDYKYIDEAIDYMQLKEFEDRYLDELSGGQRQRAYIAMVIAQNSDYIFLDEP
mgnify:CR=1 FL=1